MAAALDLLDAQVQSFGRAVAGVGVVVGEDLGSPRSQRVAQRADLGHVVVRAGGDGLVDQDLGVVAVRRQVDVAHRFFGQPSAEDLVVGVADSQAEQDAILAPFVEAFRTGEEQFADPRVTRLGKILRTFSVDEIPQLFNVLKGEMALVGPRPVVPAELAKHGEYEHFYLDVRPGMTGAWQTGGRSRVDYPERAQIDADYVAGWSFWRDIKILLLTIPAVLRRQGAH